MKDLKLKKNWVREYEDAERLLGDLEVLLEFYEQDEADQDEVSRQLDLAEEAMHDAFAAAIQPFHRETFLSPLLATAPRRRARDSGDIEDFSSGAGARARH